jgi:ubiquitin carboxyl-terminal hydrolase 8
VNMVNPIGTKGHLAAAFAAILHDMWKQDQTYLVPTQFRVSVLPIY